MTGDDGADDDGGYSRNQSVQTHVYTEMSHVLILVKILSYG